MRLCSPSSSPAGTSSHCWYCVFDPWSHANPLYSAAECGSPLSIAIQYVDPAYSAISGYYNEVQAIENGCSYWTSVKYGFQGALGAAGTIGLAGGIAAGGEALVAVLSSSTGLTRRRAWDSTQTSAACLTSWTNSGAGV